MAAALPLVPFIDRNIKFNLEQHLINMRKRDLGEVPPQLDLGLYKNLSDVVVFDNIKAVAVCFEEGTPKSYPSELPKRACLVASVCYPSDTLSERIIAIYSLAQMLELKSNRQFLHLKWCVLSLNCSYESKLA